MKRAGEATASPKENVSFNRSGGAILLGVNDQRQINFIGQLVPETFQPFLKNPHLAQIFTQMGRSEELGTRLRNVYKFSKSYSGSDQIIFFEDDIFKATIPLSKSYSEKGDSVLFHLAGNGDRFFTFAFQFAPLHCLPIYYFDDPQIDSPSS